MILFIFFLLIVAFIDMSFSATFFYFNPNVDLSEDYKIMRDKSVYRGLFFTYSTQYMKQICQDTFESHLEHTRDKKHEQNNIKPEDEIKSNLPIIVGKASFYAAPILQEEELFAKCDGKNYQIANENVDSDASFFISTAFYNGWFFYAYVNEEETKNSFFLWSYIVLSPEYVPYEQPELEERYFSIRKTIKKLAETSSLLIESIETHDNLTNLVSSRVHLLWSSIFSSSVYRKQKLMFAPPDVEDGIECTGYQKEMVQFPTVDFIDKQLLTDCIPCEVFNGLTNQFETFYLTRSYDDEDSIYILRKIDEVILLDKYFKNIPVLMNPDEKVLSNF